MKTTENDKPQPNIGDLPEWVVFVNEAMAQARSMAREKEQNA